MNATLAALFAVGVVLAPQLAIAQATPQPNEPASNQPQAKEPAPPPTEQRAYSANDPRVCLEFATNMEVHVCAEKYLPRRRGR